MKKFKDHIKQSSEIDKKLYNLLTTRHFCYAHNHGSGRLVKFDSQETAELASSLLRRTYGESNRLVYGHKFVNDIMFDIENDMLVASDVDVILRAIENFSKPMITEREVRYNSVQYVQKLVFERSEVIF